MKNITAKEFSTKIHDDDSIILDVRTEMEFNQIHIKGSILIPHDEIIARHIEMDYSKDKKIYVICRSGNRSLHACSVLERLGYTNAYNVIGGFLSLGSLLEDKDIISSQD